MALRWQILSLKQWPVTRTSPNPRLHIPILKKQIILLSLSAFNLKVLLLNFLHLMCFIFKDSLFYALPKGLFQLSPHIKPNKLCLMLSIWDSKKCRISLVNFYSAKPRRGNYFPTSFSPNSIFFKKRKSMTEFSFSEFAKSAN